MHWHCLSRIKTPTQSKNERPWGMKFQDESSQGWNACQDDSDFKHDALSKHCHSRMNLALN